MKTRYDSMCYQDFWQTIETDAIKLTPENAFSEKPYGYCSMVFSVVAAYLN